MQRMAEPRAEVVMHTGFAGSKGNGRGLSWANLHIHTVVNNTETMG